MRLYKILALLSLCLLSACSTVGYYSQSIQGQLNLLFKREAISDLTEHPDTPIKLKQDLERAVLMRQFASKTLALPDNKSYLYYADINRPYVVWNVAAAPEFSLSPTKWCYPIVGCVSYRGYFKEEDALSEAEELEKKNLDVHVRGVTAYSTLGWFDDPLLNTMLHWRDRALAGLIFHELSHQLIYLKNETSFNEAFSSSVERLGTIQWLLTFYPDQINDYLRYLNAQADFRALLLDTREQLDKLYNGNLSMLKKRQQKAAIIDQMKTNYEKIKTTWPKQISYDGWFSKPINNARLTSAMTYLQKIPAFYQIFLEQRGNWQKFYDAVKELEKLSSDERSRLIEEKSKIEINYETLISQIENNLNKLGSN